MVGLLPHDASSGIPITMRGAASNSWGQRARFFVLSLMLHIAALWVLVAFAHRVIIHAVPPSIPIGTQDIFFLGRAGGSGAHDAIPMSKGDLPLVDPKALVRPAIVVPRQTPRLPMPAGIEAAPELKFERTGTLGDPWAQLLGPLSNGTGRGPGGGDGDGPNWGRGKGPGITPGAAAVPGAGHVVAPRPLFAPDPEYTDQARQLKLQGTVTLWVVVGPDGTTRDIRVVRSLGSGLDEKAIEAVRHWRFSPGTVDGNPVAVQINVEVNFRLY